MTHRIRAFQTDNPPGWLPAIRDKVLIRNIPKTIGNLTSTAIVIGHTIDPEIVRIKAMYGSRVFNQLWKVSDLRPFNKPKDSTP